MVKRDVGRSAELEGIVAARLIAAVQNGDCGSRPFDFHARILVRKHSIAGRMIRPVST